MEKVPTRDGMCQCPYLVRILRSKIYMDCLSEWKIVDVTSWREADGYPARVLGHPVKVA